MSRFKKYLIEMSGIEPGDFHMQSERARFKKYLMEMPGIEPGAFHMQSEHATIAPHPPPWIFY